MRMARSLSKRRLIVWHRLSPRSSLVRCVATLAVSSTRRPWRMDAQLIEPIAGLFHTAPNVPHCNKNKAKGMMKKGHVFTVEPMINLGTYQDTTWGDNWTAVTADGKRSAQFEHTVLVTDDGCEILTARNDEPVMTWKPELNHR